MQRGNRHRVAVAALDESTVAEHLGSSPLFLVFEVEGERARLVEVRRNRKEYLDAEGEEGGTTRSCWGLVDEMLADVQVVIAAGMGENAYTGLLRRNILPIVCTERDVERALMKYLGGRLDDHPEMIHPPHYPRRERE